MKQIYQMKGELRSRVLSVFSNIGQGDLQSLENIHILLHCCRAPSVPDTFLSESRHPKYAEQQQQQVVAAQKTFSRQTIQQRDDPPNSRHQKRSSQRQFRNSGSAGSAFQYNKDSNFEFSSDWNQTDYGSIDVLAEPVTEMTDAKMQELGFPVQPADADNSPFHNSERHQNLPAPSVIDKHSQFFQLMSRKYCSPLGNNWDPTCWLSYVLILFPISIQDSQFL